MMGASSSSRFSGGSVRVGRTEAHSNKRPRRMTVYRVVLCHSGTEPGLQADWILLPNYGVKNTFPIIRAIFGSLWPEKRAILPYVNQPLTLSIHCWLTDVDIRPDDGEEVLTYQLIGINEWEFCVIHS